MALPGVLTAAPVAAAPVDPAPVAAASSAFVDADGAVVAVNARTSGRIDLFTIGSLDRNLHHRTFLNGQWSGWEDLGGGPFKSAPSAVSWEAGHLDVFVRGSDDRLKHRSMLKGSGWSGWEDLGGQLTSAPSATSMRKGHIDVFYRGADNALWHRYFDKQWMTAHHSLGGTLTSAPSAVSWGDNHMDVFARGADNALHHVYFLNKWSGWSSLGGSLASAPSAASWAPNHIDVFVRSADDSLQHRYFDKKWYSWSPIGGSLASAPAAASWGKGHLTVFGLDKDKALQQVTLGSNGAWPSLQRVFGLAPAVAQPRFSPVSVRQAAPGLSALGTVEFAYVDNLGILRHARLAGPEVWNSAQFTAVGGDETFGGQPAIAQQPDGRVQVVGHNVDGDMWAFTQRDPNLPDWSNPSDLGGWLTSAPSVGRLPDGRLALFGVDADGRLWARVQTAVNGAYGSWADLGAAGLAEAPVISAARGGLQLFARDSAGVLKAATYFGAATKLAWTVLSPAGMTGTPAVAPYPGFRARIVLRQGDGTLVTRLQDIDGSWPGDWQPLGSFQAAGSPAAILDPTLNRVAVVARGADNEIYRLYETAPGSGTWGTWSKAVLGTDRAASDPTVAPIRDSEGQTFIVAFRSPDDVIRVYKRSTIADEPSVSARAARVSAKPTFTAHTLPKARTGR
jgi:hypothetical protein